MRRQQGSGCQNQKQEMRGEPEDSPSHSTNGGRQTSQRLKGTGDSISNPSFKSLLWFLEGATKSENFQVPSGRQAGNPLCSSFIVKGNFVDNWKNWERDGQRC